MKKLVKIALLSFITVALLAGCKDATATVSNPKEMLIKIGNVTVTKGDVYAEMMKDDASNTVVNLALKQIANAEVETTDDIKKEAQSTYDDYKAQIESTGVDFETGLKQYGYASAEEFMDYCISTVKADRLLDKYIDENWDKLVEENKPVKAKMIWVDGSNGMEDAQKEANEAIALLKSGVSFEEVSEKYNDRSAYAEEKLYTLANNSTLDYNVLQFMLNTATPTLSEAIQANTGSAYYVVQVTNTNINQMKDEFITAYKNMTNTRDTVFHNYFKAHKFTIYDIDVFNTVKANYPSYLVQND
ncbi:MAG: hypothetical protein IIZ98_04080 [Erysipelotrichaceae bacterium]|nr:hypothetical protein [Erysipelotrichaceae bacterium]MBQ1757494.1 hypothetical protein [Erysipelotrichaceae bacterium]